MAIEAFVLTGQGSQFVGMGRILLDNSITERTAAQTYRDGSRISGVDVRALCTTGSKEDLLATANTQLAVAVTDIILLRVYIDVVKITPDVVAGHSLGQIPAFHAVGALTFEQTVELTKERGRAMEEAGRRHPGMMAAVKNLEREDIERICEEAHIKIANYNLGQVVISG